MKKARVFVDSNIWFSAFYGEGNCLRLIRLLSKGPHEIVICEQVLEEVLRNVKKKIPKAFPYVIEYITKISPTNVKDPKGEELLDYHSYAKHHDLPILVSAINYSCRYFITGNSKDFDIKKIKDKANLLILSPKRFLEEFMGIKT